MSTQSKIEWTEQTWNPTTGCTKVSPGCKHCYAETMSKRLVAMGAAGYANGFEITMHPSRLNQPLKRKKPTTYFVNSMSDLFHEGVTDAFIDSVLQVITDTPQHTYQILTKRSERLPEFFANRICPKNLWLGVSVEDKKYGLPRIAHLTQVKAAIKFLSVEPLIEDIGFADFTGIDWVIVGGESGHKARPMRPEWVSQVKTNADKAGAKFFFKQWGTWSAEGIKRNKLANGRLFNGLVWDNYPATMHSKH
jgi:protein gp37